MRDAGFECVKAPRHREVELDGPNVDLQWCLVAAVGAEVRNVPHPGSCCKIEEIGHQAGVLDPPPKIEWHGRSAATDDNAAKTLWLEGRGEEQCSGANVGTDGVGILEPKCVRKSNNELAHRARRQKRVAPLRVTESRQVDCN